MRLQFLLSLIFLFFGLTVNTQCLAQRSDTPNRFPMGKNYWRMDPDTGLKNFARTAPSSAIKEGTVSAASPIPSDLFSNQSSDSSRTVAPRTVTQVRYQNQFGVPQDGLAVPPARIASNQMTPSVPIGLNNAVLQTANKPHSVTSVNRGPVSRSGKSSPSKLKTIQKTKTQVTGRRIVAAKNDNNVALPLIQEYPTGLGYSATQSITEEKVHGRVMH